jgi:Translation initiation factor eIF3 subunit 135
VCVCVCASHIGMHVHKSTHHTHTHTHSHTQENTHIPTHPHTRKHTHTLWCLPRLRPLAVLAYSHPRNSSCVHVRAFACSQFCEQAFPIPLSSDALTNFQRHDPDRREHSSEVYAATRHLFNEVIPSFARDLNKQEIRPVDHIELVSLLHKRGINMRHLGIVRSGVNPPHLRSFLLSEMCMRVCKNVFREHMRAQSDVLANASELHVRAVDFFNLVFGDGEESQRFWKRTLKLYLHIQFISALSDDEMSPQFDLRKQLLLFPLFQSLQKSTGTLCGVMRALLLCIPGDCQE